jgi:hypothetical protein
MTLRDAAAGALTSQPIKAFPMSLKHFARVSLKTLALRPQLVLVLACVVLVLALLASSNTRVYATDDVAQQNAVSPLTLHSRPVLDLPQNTYILKLPLYAALQALPLAPSAKLRVTVLVLNLTGFLLFLWAAQSLIRIYAPAKITTLTPLLWLPSLGITLAGLLANPNSRNLEIGLAFAALVLIARWYKGEWSASLQQDVTLGVLAAALLGLLFYDDPYTVYIIAIPIALFFGAKWLVLGRDSRALILSVVMLTALVFANVWHGFFWLLGIHAGNGSAAFASLPSIPRNAGLFVQGVLDIFSANIFLGLPVVGIHSLAVELNFLILISTLLSPLLLVFRKVRQDIWKLFIVLQPPFIAGVFIFGSMPVNAGSERYLVVLPFYAVLVVTAVVLPLLTRRARNILAAAMLLAATLNVVSTVQIYLAGTSNPNAENQEVARIAEAHHLTKGYASYWNAGINQYYADNKILFIQSGCSRTTGVKPYRFLLNEQVLHRQASNSFYLFDPAATRCTEADFARYFGEPQGMVDLSGRKRLLLYNYDITTQMRLN